jgi:hypothetical protein
MEPVNIAIIVMLGAAAVWLFSSANRSGTLNAGIQGDCARHQNEFGTIPLPECPGTSYLYVKNPEPRGTFLRMVQK